MPVLTERGIAVWLLTQPLDVRRVGTAALLKRNPALRQQWATTPVTPLSPADQALKAACRFDLRRFAQAFFPHRFSLPASSMHQDFFTAFTATVGKPNIREALAAPRDSAKSTVKTFLESIHAVCYGDDRTVYPTPPFIIVLSSRADLSVEKVKEIGDELLLNTALQRVFGDLKGETHNQGHILARTGTRILAASPRSQVRGFLRRGQRPSRLVLDDVENSEHVQTEAQRVKFFNFVMQDLLNVLTPTGSVTVIGTVLHPQSFLARLVSSDPQRHIPGFRSQVYRSILRWNTAYARWQQWHEIFTEPLNQDAADEARAFFIAHEAEMTQDAEVLWPEREDYYSLMVLRCIEGDLAFFTEKQNEPWRDASYLFDLSLALYFDWAVDHIVLDNGQQLPLSIFTDVIAFWDPALGESGTRGDWSACPVLAWAEAYNLFLVLDCYLTQDVPMEQQLPALAQFLWQWDVRHLGLETNAFQSLLTGQLRQAMTKVATEEGGTWAVPPIEEVRQIRAKPLRISTLQPMVHGKRLGFSRALPGECFRQLAEYRALSDAGHDDVPDSIEGAIRVARRLLDRRVPR